MRLGRFFEKKPPQTPEKTFTNGRMPEAGNLEQINFADHREKERFVKSIFLFSSF